jgi:nucleoside-diphosphate-sugar epimerase
MSQMTRIESEGEIEERLATPGAKDIQLMRSLPGDVIVLGAGGKMGPSLTKLAARASQAAGINRRIMAVSRFLSPHSQENLQRAGVETIACDLLDRDALATLPDAENVLFLAGRKFGSFGRPDITWAMNGIVPANAAYRYRHSRIVAFSTGNVYPFVNPQEGTDFAGSRESDEPQPHGEYAQSCLGRERLFEFYSREYGTPCLLLRLNYAMDLRYGVLVDIAHKVFHAQPVDLTVGYFNTIWQRDANSYALRCLELCASPPRALNVTGPEIISVRQAAEYFSHRFGRPALFSGQESGKSLLSDASLCRRLLGEPDVRWEELREWVAHWVEIGGRNLNKPTHFEAINGKF